MISARLVAHSTTRKRALDRVRAFLSSWQPMRVSSASRMLMRVERVEGALCGRVTDVGWVANSIAPQRLLRQCLAAAPSGKTVRSELRGPCSAYDLGTRGHPVKSLGKLSKNQSNSSRVFQPVQ